VASQENDPDSQLNFYRKAIALRKEYKDAAIYGQFNLHLKGHKQLFVYDKIGEDGTKLTVIINLSAKTLSSKRALKYICPKSTEILSNYEGEIGAKLHPYEARVFACNYKNCAI
jgi:alpha-glucosidase